MNSTIKLAASIIIFCQQFFLSYRLFAQDNNPSPITFPAPAQTSNMLFYLQRDPNINTLIYGVNLKSNGEVNTSQPITSYWIRYAEKGQRNELDYIQRKFAYGVTSREISKNKYEFRFVSRKSMPFIWSRQNLANMR